MTCTSSSTCRERRSDYSSATAGQSTDSLGSVWTRTGVDPDGQAIAVPPRNQFAAPWSIAGVGWTSRTPPRTATRRSTVACTSSAPTSGGSSSAQPCGSKAGEWAENPNTQDRLPAKKARTAISDSLVFNAVTGYAQRRLSERRQPFLIGHDISSRSRRTSARPGRTPRRCRRSRPAPRATGPVLPVDRADERREACTRSGSTTGGPQRRLIETFQADWSDEWRQLASSKISTAAYDPNQGFFSCGCSSATTTG